MTLIWQKKHFSLTWKIMMLSGRNFAYHMAKLSGHGKLWSDWLIANITRAKVYISKIYLMGLWTIYETGLWSGMLPFSDPSIGLKNFWIGHVTLVGIPGTIILVSYLFVKSLKLLWKSDSYRFHLWIPDLQVSCRDVTSWQDTKIIAPVP